MTDTLVRPSGTNFGTPHALLAPLDEAWGRGTAPTAVPEPRTIAREVVDVLFEWARWSKRRHTCASSSRLPTP